MKRQQPIAQPGVVASAYIMSLNFSLNHLQKIDGWVARNATGKILFFKGKQAPSKPNYEKLPKQWHGSAPPDNGIPIVPQSAFPEVTWDSEPLEVTIIIKPKEK